LQSDSYQQPDAGSPGLPVDPPPPGSGPGRTPGAPRAGASQPSRRWK